MTDAALVTVGPYTLKVEGNANGISKIEISHQSLNKSKNLNTKLKQFERLAQKFVHGDGKAFESVELDLVGTEFQKKVWKAVRAIPYGETRTYADIAKKIGHPKAVRAVGTALGKNPVCIVVPCHRVVPSSGGIGNYAYGKAMKQWLLDHEAGRASIRPSPSSGHSASQISVPEIVRPSDFAQQNRTEDWKGATNAKNCFL